MASVKQPPFVRNELRVSLCHGERPGSHIEMTKILLNDSGVAIDKQCLLMLQPQQYAMRLGWDSQGGQNGIPIEFLTYLLTRLLRSMLRIMQNICEFSLDKGSTSSRICFSMLLPILVEIAHMTPVAIISQRPVQMIVDRLQ